MLSHIAIQLFLPCLLFTSVCRSVSAEFLRDLWALPVFAGLYALLGALLALVVSRARFAVARWWRRWSLPSKGESLLSSSTPVQKTTALDYGSNNNKDVETSSDPTKPSSTSPSSSSSADPSSLSAIAASVRTPESE